MERREFIRAVALTAVAATATGAGTALLMSDEEQPTMVQEALLPTSTPPLPSVTNNDDLMAQLVQVRAENMQLQSALNIANQQISNLQSAQPTQDVLRMELTTTQEQVTILAGLVALYEELENVNLSQTVNTGMANLEELWTNLSDELPNLANGIQLGQEAIDEIEAHLPSLEDGRVWLEAQINEATERYGQLELVLQNIVDATNPVLEMLTDWFEELLDWLPFNMGQKALEVMATLKGIVSHMPPMLSGLQTTISNPLDRWLVREDETAPMALQKTVTMPLKEQLLDSAGRVATQTQTLKETYGLQIEEPVQTAVSQTNLIKTLIAQYREQHQL